MNTYLYTSLGRNSAPHFQASQYLRDDLWPWQRGGSPSVCCVCVCVCLYVCVSTTHTLPLVAHVHASRHTRTCVSSHIWMSHGTRMDESRPKYERVTSHVCMHRVGCKPDSNHILNSIDTHCNTLQHTATHCNTLLHTSACVTWDVNQIPTISHPIPSSTLQHTATYFNTLLHTAAHCCTLLHTATHCNTLLHTATHCYTLLHTATHCYTLHHIPIISHQPSIYPHT